MAGSHEQYNEHTDFIKGGEFTDRLTDYHLLKKRSAQWLYLDNTI
jgi:hypothetical protein